MVDCIPKVPTVLYMLGSKQELPSAQWQRSRIHRGHARLFPLCSISAYAAAESMQRYCGQLTDYLRQLIAAPDGVAALRAFLEESYGLLQLGAKKVRKRAHTRSDTVICARDWCICSCLCCGDSPGGEVEGTKRSVSQCAVSPRFVQYQTALTQILCRFLAGPPPVHVEHA